MSFPDDLVKQLVLISEIFSNALMRKRNEEALATALSEIKALKKKVEIERDYLREEIKMGYDFENIIGESDIIKQTLAKATQVAPTDSTVLISGETGTGKEMFARMIHKESLRKNNSLIKVDCSTLAANIIESELFGHERGSFTGAHANRIGRFELADGATIFLDEIGEFSLELQAKLLRVIQEGEFERLGSSRTKKVDVRIIAATNRDLNMEVKKGRFREDLWYRLNVYPIIVPPLRSRKDDIPLLVEFFVEKFNKTFGKNITIISPETIGQLQRYKWPGNIRELKNVLERAMINATGSELYISDTYLRDTLDLPLVKEHQEETQKSLAEVQRQHIIEVLEKTRWKITGNEGAAAILDLPPSTLRSRMEKLRIKKLNKSRNPHS